MSVRVLVGDCREVLATLDAESFHACVTDPPYELGFMGKAWDRSGVAFNHETWRAVARVLKPGAHLIAFGAPRNYHRLACAIEDAGFEIRDCLMWMFATGFPKSSNQRGKWEGWGTGLKPAYEPIILARKPFKGSVPSNLEAHETGALNIDASRIETGDGYTENAVTQGINTARTSYDPRQARRTFEPSQAGRWPANVIHDGSDEVLAAFPDALGQQGDLTGNEPNCYGEMNRTSASAARGDSGSAARFFYTAKASASDRGDGNTHPTVKPTDLMQYLVRLVTRRGGRVLDPFGGSGTTGIAADREQMDAVLIELEEAHAEIARNRLRADSPLFTEVA